MVAFSAASVSLTLLFSLYGPSELAIVALNHFPFSVPILNPFSDTALILEGLPQASPVPPGGGDHRAVLERDSRHPAPKHPGDPPAVPPLEPALLQHAPHLSPQRGSKRWLCPLVRSCGLVLLAGGCYVSAARDRGAALRLLPPRGPCQEFVLSSSSSPRPFITQRSRLVLRPGGTGSAAPPQTHALLFTCFPLPRIKPDTGDPLPPGVQCLASALPLCPLPGCPPDWLPLSHSQAAGLPARGVRECTSGPCCWSERLNLSPVACCFASQLHWGREVMLSVLRDCYWALAVLRWEALD